MMPIGRLYASSLDFQYGFLPAFFNPASFIRELFNRLTHFLFIECVLEVSTLSRLHAFTEEILDLRTVVYIIEGKTVSIRKAQRDCSPQLRGRHVVSEGRIPELRHPVE